MKSEKWMFVVTNIVLVTLVFIYIFMCFFPDSNLLQSQCTFLKFFGWYCPGCGGTRAFKAFMHGKWMTSLYYHPFVPYSLILMIAYSVSNWMEKITKGKLKIRMHFQDWYLYAGLVIIIINFIIKNIFLYFGTTMV